MSVSTGSTVSPYTSSGFPGQTFHADGFMGGGQIGWNWQRGSIVYGVEASGSLGSLRRDVGNYDDKMPWLAMLRGRVGYTLDHPPFHWGDLIAARSMVYVTGGLALAGIEADGPAGFGKETGTGWTVGIGVEKRLWQQHSLVLEYDYVDLSPVTISPGSGSVVDGAGHIFKIGLNFRNLWN